MPTSPPNAAKFIRMDASVRRERLTEATISAIVEEGYSAASVRKICKRAGVSPSLLRHYYSGKSELVLDAYNTVLAEFLDGAAQILQESDQAPRDKLVLFINACFDTKSNPERRLSLMLAFWSELRLHPEMRPPAITMFAQYRKMLIEVIEQVALDEGNQDEVDATLVAISLMALIDGMWLELYVDPEGFRLSDAKLGCFGLLDGFLFCGTNQKWLQERGAGRG